MAGVIAKKNTFGFIAESQGNKENLVLDNSVDKYPTNNLVKNELLASRLLFKQNTTIAHTGTTAETIISTYLIPSNTIQANDIIKWLLNYLCTNNANAKDVKCYFNTTPDLSGSPIQVAVRNTLNLAGNSMGRELISNNSQTSQKILAVTSNFSTTESATGIGSLTSTSIDFTIDQYFVVSVKLANASDILTFQYLFANLLR